MTLGEPVSIGAALMHFLRVTVSDSSGRLGAHLTGPQGSGILSSMALADGLLIVPPERPRVEAGEVMRAILLDDPVHVEEPGW